MARGVNQEPWALEETLKSLVAQSRDQVRLLNAIAVASKADTAGLTTSVSGLSTSASKLEDAVDKNSNDTKSLKNSLLGAIGKIDSVAGSNANSMMSKLSGGVGQLSTVLGQTRMGKLAGYVAVAAESFNLMWQRTTELADATFSAYDSGIVFSGGMTQLAKSASDVGLSLADFGKLLSKNGQVVASMGIKRTNELGKAFTEATRGGIDLGMTFDQAQQTLLSYAEQQRYSGNLNKMSTEEITQGAQEYGKQLNVLAQLTGKRREQIDQEIKDAMKRPNIQILINSLSGPAREAAEKGMKLVMGTFGEQGTKMQDMIARYHARGMAGLTQQEQTGLQLTHTTDQFIGLVNATFAGSQEDIMKTSKAFTETGQEYLGHMEAYNELPNATGEALSSMQQLVTAGQTVAQNTQKLGQDMPSDAGDVKNAQQNLNKAANTLDLALSSLAAQAVGQAIPAINAAGVAANYAADGMMKLAEYLHGDLIPTNADKLQMAAGVAAAVGVALSGLVPSIVSSVTGIQAGKSVFQSVGEAGTVAEGTAGAATAAGRTAGGIRGALTGTLAKASALLGGAVEAYDAYNRTGSVAAATGAGVGGTVGGYGGALAGGLAGAEIGAILGPIGAGVGGLIGAGIGAYFGTPAGADVGEHISTSIFGGEAARNAVESVSPSTNLGTPGAPPPATSTTSTLAGQGPGADSAINRGGSSVIATTVRTPQQIEADNKHQQMIQALVDIRTVLDNMTNIEDRQLTTLKDGFARVSGNIY